RVKGTEIEDQPIVRKQRFTPLPSQSAQTSGVNSNHWSRPSPSQISQTSRVTVAEAEDGPVARKR
ncbi:hypothetical protein PMAYCL1PPCAC_03832, partial [Pristionchus mayeri]